MFGESTGFALTWEEGAPPSAQVRGPDEEATAAFVLCYRFFVQDGREKISFRSMAQLYEQIAPADLRAEFQIVHQSP